MDRRKFVRTLGQGSAALALGLHAGHLFGQTTPPPQYPVDCSPPAHGQPKKITFDTTIDVLPRKSVWDLSAGELDRLRAAYQALRDLSVKDPSDPRGWMQQANVHCFNCSGGFDPSNVEIHGSWWFMPWHRCYLHVHERILGQLIGDPSFRLAYWDWDSYPQHATLPPPFVPAGQSLYDVYRGVTGADVVPRRIVGPTAMGIVLGTQSTDAFMGQLSDPSKNIYHPGAMENSPHGPVHIWTGYPGNPGQPNEPAGCFYPNDEGGQPVDQSSNGCMDMGVLASAARDPIFYAHHSNIDRLWDVWNGMPGSQGNPQSADWANQRFTFYDQNGDWVYISIADVVGTNEEANLRYAYQQPQSAPAAATVFVASAKATPRPRRTTGVRSMSPLTVHDAATPTPVGTTPHIRTIALPDAHQENLRRFAAARGTSQRRYYMHIEGLTLPAHESTIVDVFIGDVDPETVTEHGASFVGTFSVVASGRHASHHQVMRNALFELRPATAALLVNADQLKVTLIPTLPSGARPRRSSLTYRRIYLSVR